MTSVIHWKWRGESEFETYLRGILNRIGEEIGYRAEGEGGEWMKILVFGL